MNCKLVQNLNMDPKNKPIWNRMKWNGHWYLKLKWFRSINMFIYLKPIKCSVLLDECLIYLLLYSQLQICELLEPSAWSQKPIHPL